MQRGCGASLTRGVHALVSGWRCFLAESFLSWLAFIRLFIIHST
jgi:hypothetical protein